MSKAVRLAADTLQFFEVDIPKDMTPEDFIETDEFRKACADLIISGMIEFRLERLFDTNRNQVG